MWPPVKERGAKGPRRRETEIHRERDLRMSDWRRNMEEAMRRRERERQRKRRDLLCRPEAGPEAAGEDVAVGRD